MSTKASPTMIGAFVVGGIILAIIAILLLSSGGLFKDRPKVIMYFQDSVKGLNVGAPVTLRGVQIGTVTEITLVHDAETAEIWIPVIMEFNPESISERKDTPDEDRLHSLVDDHGLRAQLNTASLITGQLYVQVDYFPGTPYKYYGSGDLPEIPTIPTEFARLRKKLEDIDFASIFEDISETTAAIRKIATLPELEASVKNMNQTLISLNNLIVDLDKRSDSLITNSDKSLEELQSTLQEARDTMANIKQLTHQESPTVYNMNTALEEIANAARSLRALADTLERHPEAFIRGKSTKD